MKRFFLSLVLAAGLLSPAIAAGTLPGISMSQQLDTDGRPLNGGRLYLIQAGTTSTPQNCYQDSGLTIAWPNPVTLDSAGRVPQLFCADGSIKVRLTNSVGVQKLVQDNLLVVGPSGGGGGGGSVDPTTILQTGQIVHMYGTGSISGFVRCNGRTIGSATSGATERANADTSALFVFLYNADPNLSVSGGRGASAAADFAANKTIALPDCRGRVLAGLPDMGASAASWLTSTYFGTTLALGAVSTTTDHVTLVTGNLPPYTPTQSTGTFAATNGPFLKSAGGVVISATVGSGGTAMDGVQAGTGGLVQPTGNVTVTMNAQGGISTPFSSIQPTILATIYIKL